MKVERSASSKNTRKVLYITILFFLSMILAISSISIYFSFYGKKLVKIANPLSWSIDSWDGQGSSGKQFVSNFADRGYNSFTIDSAESFVWFVESVNNGVPFKNKTVYLNKNLDFDGLEIDSIGKNGYVFEGVFDGGFYTISNLKINGSGLFEETNHATIKNVGLYNVEIKASSNYAGGLIGRAENTNIENSFVRLGNVVGPKYVGGLVGLFVSNYGTPEILNSFTDTSLTGEYVAGLIGKADILSTQNKATISYCYYNNAPRLVNNDPGETLLSKMNVKSINSNTKFYDWNYSSKYDVNKVWCDYDYATHSRKLDFTYPIQTGFVKVYLTGAYYENTININGEIKHTNSLVEAVYEINKNESVEATITVIIEKVESDITPIVIEAGKKITLKAAKNSTLTRHKANEESIFGVNAGAGLILGEKGLANDSPKLIIDGNREWVEANDKTSGALIIAKGSLAIHDGVVLKNNINNRPIDADNGIVPTSTGLTNDYYYTYESNSNGGAIAIYYSNWEMTGGYIYGCYAENNGGAIYSSAWGEITGGTIESCSAGINGGAIYMAGSLMFGSTENSNIPVIRDNYAGYNGEAIYVADISEDRLYSSSLTLTGIGEMSASYYTSNEVGLIYVSKSESGDDHIVKFEPQPNATYTDTPSIYGTINICETARIVGGFNNSCDIKIVLMNDETIEKYTSTDLIPLIEVDAFYNVRIGNVYAMNLAGEMYGVQTGFGILYDGGVGNYNIDYYYIYGENKNVLVSDILGNTYETLEEAISDSISTVYYIHGNLEISSPIYFWNGEYILLPLDKDVSITPSSSFSGNTSLFNLPYGHLTIGSGTNDEYSITIDTTAWATSSAPAINLNSGAMLTLNKGMINTYSTAIASREGCIVTINSGYVYGESGPAISLYGSYMDPTYFVMNGGYVSCAGDSNYYAPYGITLSGNVDVTLNGGYISGEFWSNGLDNRDFYLSADFIGSITAGNNIVDTYYIELNPELINTYLNNSTKLVNTNTKGLSFKSVDTSYTISQNGYLKENIPVAQITDVKYSSLESALYYANNGDTIMILEDIELTKTLVIDKSIKLKANKNVKISLADNFEITQLSAIEVYSSLTIGDVDDYYQINFDLSYANHTSVQAMIFVGGSRLVVNKATIYQSRKGDNYDISLDDTGSYSQVYINEGASVESLYSRWGDAVINGGNVNKVDLYSGNVTVNKGRVGRINVNETFAYPSTITLSNNAIVEDCIYIEYNYDNTTYPNINLSQNILNEVVIKFANNSARNAYLDTTLPLVNFNVGVQAGSSKFIVENYYVYSGQEINSALNIQDYEDSSLYLRSQILVPTNAVAHVGTRYFSQLTDAIDYASSGDVVYLIKNINLASTIYINKSIKLVAEKNITISRNGNFIMFDFDGLSQDLTDTYDFIIGEANDDNYQITFDGASYTSAIISAHVYDDYTENTIESKLIINSGIFTRNSKTVNSVAINSNMCTEINGGIIKNFDIGIAIVGYNSRYVRENIEILRLNSGSIYNCNTGIKARPHEFSNNECVVIDGGTIYNCTYAIDNSAIGIDEGAGYPAITNSVELKYLSGEILSDILINGAILTFEGVGEKELTGHVLVQQFYNSWEPSGYEYDLGYIYCDANINVADDTVLPETINIKCLDTRTLGVYLDTDTKLINTNSLGENFNYYDNNDYVISSNGYLQRRIVRVSFNINNSIRGYFNKNHIDVPVGTTYTTSSNNVNFSNGEIITVYAYEGYIFSSWSRASGVVSRDITITANMTAIASTISTPNDVDLTYGYTMPVSLNFVVGGGNGIFIYNLVDVSSNAVNLLNIDTVNSTDSNLVVKFSTGAGVGVYTFKVKVSSGNDTSATSNEISITVSRRDINITANDVSIQYMDNIPTFSYKISGLVGSDTYQVISGEPVYTIREESNVNSSEIDVSNLNVGDYYIHVSNLMAENYNINYVAGLLTVNPINIGTDANISVELEEMEFSYTGNDIIPNLIVKYKNEVVQSTNYSLSYIDNINVGTAKIIIEGKNNYSGSLEMSFTIKKAVLDIPSQINTSKYSGEIIVPSWYGYNTTLMTISGEIEGVEAGSYVVRFSLKDTTNYIWSNGDENAVVEWRILPTDNTARVQANNLIYNGTSQELIMVSNAVGMVYYSTTEELTAENYTYKGSNTIPTATNADNYVVYYYILGDTNFHPASGSVETVISHYKLNISTYNTTWTGENVYVREWIGVNSEQLMLTYRLTSTDVGSYTYSEDYSLEVNNDNYIIESAGVLSLTQNTVIINTTIPSNIELNCLAIEEYTVSASVDGSFMVRSSNEDRVSVSINDDTITIYALQPIDNAIITISFEPTDNINYSSPEDIEICVSVSKSNNMLQVTPIENLVYNGTAQTLVNVSNAQGEVYFSTEHSLNRENYLSGNVLLPSKVDAGRHTVYYYSVGNDNYLDGFGSVDVVISSTRLTNPTNPIWTDVTVASWTASTAVAGITTTYQVELKDGDTVIATKEVSTTTVDFASEIYTNGTASYTFEVIAQSSNTTNCANSDRVISASANLSPITITMSGTNVGTATVGTSNVKLVETNKYVVVTSNTYKLNATVTDALLDMTVVVGSNTTVTKTALRILENENITVSDDTIITLEYHKATSIVVNKPTDSNATVTIKPVIDTTTDKTVIKVPNAEVEEETEYIIGSNAEVEIEIQDKEGDEIVFGFIYTVEGEEGKNTQLAGDNIEFSWQEETDTYIVNNPEKITSVEVKVCKVKNYTINTNFLTEGEVVSLVSNEGFVEKIDWLTSSISLYAGEWHIISTLDESTLENVLNMSVENAHGTLFINVSILVNLDGFSSSLLPDEGVITLTDSKGNEIYIDSSTNELSLEPGTYIITFSDDLFLLEDDLESIFDVDIIDNNGEFLFIIE